VGGGALNENESKNPEHPIVLLKPLYVEKKIIWNVNMRYELVPQALEHCILEVLIHFGNSSSFALGVLFSFLARKRWGKSTARFTFKRETFDE
jgi:hypothetical protein